ncbi:unnamed protein product [Ambrosiozyma monospora]|uniref:Unnamed protein product n=1 Tax=Ambrosiozyma monospora TaxID=43982 RepID=A0ACB5T7Z4_AMBMO|nr:unnamed protein product [Ambrosiozyma monospora]
MGKRLFKEEKVMESIEWFKLCVHRFLKMNLSNDDLGKIYRNILNGYLSLNKFDYFDRTITEMDSVSSNNAITQYYLFLNNLKQNKDSECIENLERLACSSDNRCLNLLALCVIDSQSLKKSNLMNLCIQRLLRKSTTSNENEVEQNCLVIPVALRTAIYLNLKEFEQCFQLSDQMKYIQLLESFYEQALKFMRKMSEEEVEWFANKAYWIGIECFKVETLTRKSSAFFGICAKLTGINGSLKIWHVRSLYFKCLCDSLIIKYAKEQQYDDGDEPIDSSKPKESIDWFTVMHQIETNLKPECEKLDREVYSQSLIIYLESLLELNQWEKMTSYMEQQLHHLKDSSELTRVLDGLFTLVISKGEISTSEKFKIIQTIMDIGLSEPMVEINMKVKWMRLVLDDLIDYETESTVLVKYMDTLCSMLGGTESERWKSMSSFEIEWLASKCWNNGAKLMINFNQLVTGKLWLNVSLKLSGLVNDELHKQFELMYPQLIESVREDLEVGVGAGAGDSNGVEFEASFEGCASNEDGTSGCDIELSR